MDVCCKQCGSNHAVQVGHHAQQYTPHSVLLSMLCLHCKPCSARTITSGSQNWTTLLGVTVQGPKTGLIETTVGLIVPLRALQYCISPTQGSDDVQTQGGTN
uniref:Uncharacterized protein n=1 Tax=Eutreptiella gymnastica TaxID=73025 RepID=A0A7S1JGG0_9EUGL|mmetsp:Transcript_96051/g.165600  ORF Transcript_96051/g.165600 Transcript_96051/m.165600 type:complete len:102 (+) Transcript_96051:39-344(+)